MSWPSLDKTRDDLQKKIDVDEVVLAETLGRLLRNKKLLKSAEAKAKRKAECEAFELEEIPESEEEFVVDCPAAASGVGLSPMTWQTLLSLDEMVS